MQHVNPPLLRQRKILLKPKTFKGNLATLCIFIPIASVTAYQLNIHWVELLVAAAKCNKYLADLGGGLAAKVSTKKNP